MAVFIKITFESDVYHVEVKKDPFVIGRSRAASLKINDDSLTKKHCSISIKDNGEVIVSDLNSTNGTYINGKRIEQAVVIKLEDQVCAGDVEIKLVSSRMNSEEKKLHTRIIEEEQSDMHEEKNDEDEFEIEVEDKKSGLQSGENSSQKAEMTGIENFDSQKDSNPEDKKSEKRFVREMTGFQKMESFRDSDVSSKSKSSGNKRTSEDGLSLEKVLPKKKRRARK